MPKPKGKPPRPHRTSVPMPDGIDESHVVEKVGIRRHQSVIALGALTLVVLAALLGFFGRPDSARIATADRAELEVFGPSLIRNGEFFEMRFRVRAAETLANAVIAIDEGVWEDITVNTIIPGPVEETHEDGQFRFTLGEVAAGTEFLMKVDLQINPDFVGDNIGQIVLFDGEEQVTTLEYELGVLP